MADFFVSYTQADRSWAEWIAWELEEAGYDVILQMWDFRGNFVVEMDRAAKEAARTVAVLSPDYLASAYTQPEWAAAFARDPTSERDVLIPVRVRECDLSGLLAQVIYLDLVERDESAARELLRARILGDRLKPHRPPPWPGGARASAEKPAFPAPRGHPSTLSDVVPPICPGKEELLDEPRPRLRSIAPTIPKQPEHAKAVQSTLDTEAISRAFGAASQMLLGWPQETDGHWIERRELEQLHALALQEEPALAVLLSEPGGGKSALLARLGNQLTAGGVVLLAIKADELPHTMGHLDDFDRWVGAPMPVAEALRDLARERRVVLLIDQLDALAELMDQHSQRLSVLLRLVGRVRGIRNLQILLSCREFEYRNDIRLITLGTEAITLARPSWEQIAALMVARGIDPSGWSAEVREILRTPQHLAVFLQHCLDNAFPVFSSYQALLEQVVRRLEQSCGSHAVEAAERIAMTMGEEEELYLGAARFDRDWRDELIRLERADVLAYSKDRLSLTFRHQTLFEFLRSRAFLRHDLSVADYVIREKQESLFVRPILWSALHYLRGADRAVYRREFCRLWMHDALRLHLKYLLISFLGQLSEADDQEARWLLPTLDESSLRRTALKAMIGSPGWFARLSSRLVALMTAPPETAWETVGILKMAIEFDRETALALLERHWLPSPTHDELALRVIDDQKRWDKRSVELAACVVERAATAPTFVSHLIERISGSQPEMAPIVLARWLDAQVRRAVADLEPPPEAPSQGTSVEGQMAWTIEYNDAVRGPFQKLLEGRDWYKLDKVAVLAPKAFIYGVWPWLLTVIERLAYEPSPLLIEYRRHKGLAFAHDDDRRSSSNSLPKAIEAASRAFAEADPSSFLVFVGANKACDLNAIHHIFALGLERVAENQPLAVLGYLLEDRRRFVIGDFYEEHRDSRRLIAAVAPHLDRTNRLRLEQAIIGWQRYRTGPAHEDAKTRFERRKWTREQRLRLLRAFPMEHLSEKGRRHLAEEERAIPGLPDSTTAISVDWVGSPMNADQMAASSDAHIVTLFEELVDATQWDHPRHRWSPRHGGSVPASRAFADFAKDHPERAFRILERFKPRLQEQPAAQALAALAEVEAVPPARIVEQIETLTSRGFASEDFHWNAARALRSLAVRGTGLDDRACGLLEGWLTEWEPPKPVQDDDGLVEKIPELSADRQDDQSESILWGYGRAELAPGGNYALLDALMLGCLRREPMAADQWLGVLERHLSRRENPAVWEALAYDLRFLVNAERSRVLTFLERLFEAQPSILADERGVMLIASTHSWIPTELFIRSIKGWISCGWPRGPQAAGEVVALRFCLRPNDSNAGALLESFIVGSQYDTSIAASLRLGLTHTLVQAWSEAPLRPIVTPHLLRLLPLADAPMTKALQSIFAKTDPLPTDDDTRSLLRGLLSFPQILVELELGFLVDRLKDLLREEWELQLIHEILDIVVAGRGAKLGDISSTWAAHAGDLGEIALTFHRIPETRSRGIDLFEKLLSLNAYGIEQHLSGLDRRPFR